MHKKLFLKFFVLFLILVFVFSGKAFADTSNIAKISFITDPQTVKPNEISKEMTIQLQDASGNKVVALETIRFDAFQSTSPTGIFVSCTTPTNPPTDYIAKNSSNKNICYKDSTQGAYIITAKTNNTIIPLVATQGVVVSSGQNSDPNPLGGNSTTTSTTTSTTAASTTLSTTDSSSNNLVYSSYVSLSTYDTVALNVEAGRERIAYLHVPIEFKTKGVDKNTGKEIYDTHHRWSFGDGTSGEGSEVVHTYMFPGEYTVVLNSYSQNEDATDITKVKVVNADVSASYHEQYVGLTNNSNDDVNVGSWKFKGNNKEYIIPRDTIILGKGSIKIPRVVLGRAGESSSLLFTYPDDSSISEVRLLSDIDTQKQIAEIQTKLNSLNNELSIAYQNSDTGENVWVGNDSARLVSSQDVGSHIDVSKKDISETVAAPIESSAGKSIVEKVMEFFSSMFK